MHKVLIVHEDEIATLVGRGELDAFAAPELECAFDELASVPHLLVDLSGVSFMDSTALGCVVRAVRACEARKVRLKIVLPKGAARRIFEITTLDAFFPSRSRSAPLSPSSPPRTRARSAVTAAYKNFSLGVLPTVYFPTGDNGVGSGHANAGVRMLASYDTGPFEVHANAAARTYKNDFGLRDRLYLVSGAVMVTIHERLKLIADQTWETSPEPGSDASLRYTTLGAIWFVAPGTGLGCGVKLGHGEPAIDRTYICGLGIRR